MGVYKEESMLAVTCSTLAHRSASLERGEDFTDTNDLDTGGPAVQSK